ncbi:hypothetical protein [Paenibacillus sp. Marseille-Q4541]|uniref:hypothetical protein n=1 Tax=Paenibacillus sp. Marseille-Q4541 TaxID=2831522 RepID=UPI001BAD527B|nr:hypothetical protein [Paenibacillus sp. Marseille-Q4541]
MIKKWIGSKPFKLSTILTIAVLVVISVLLISFASSYFSQSVFYVNGEKYTKANEQSNLITYQSINGPPIEVLPKDDTPVVRINDEDYAISRSEDINGPIFHVSYPNGKKYKVINQSGTMFSYDENGEMVSFISIYAYDGNGTRLMNNAEEKEEELYYPGSLVEAAYPEYHEKQGTPLIYWTAVFLLVLGWCQFRYEKFQNFLFFIHPRYSWQDDEPNDFHYFLCKCCGILLMVSALPVFLKSL